MDGHLWKETQNIGMIAQSFWKEKYILDFSLSCSKKKTEFMKGSQKIHKILIDLLSLIEFFSPENSNWGQLYPFSDMETDLLNSS